MKNVIENVPQPTNNGNKYLVRLLFKHAINYLNKEENRNDEIYILCL